MANEPCTTCKAQVEETDMEFHLKWHGSQDERLDGAVTEAVDTTERQRQQRSRNSASDGWGR